MNKDYYNILEVPQNANEQEIKKAYRQLVKKFHPDKNEGNSRAEDYFKEVQEAYETLSHPARRSAYNQQRWYGYRNYKQHDIKPITAYEILHRSKKLTSYISTLDTNHINTQSLNRYIHHLLSGHNLKILIAENDRPANEAIITALLKSVDYLPYKNQEKICEILARLAYNDAHITEKITGYLKNKKSANYWNQYLPMIVLLISILLCVLIYFVSND